MKYDESVCKFNMDTGCVELLLRDGRKISIDCTGVEDALDVTMAQRSELDYLIYNDPLGYADLILNSGHRHGASASPCVCWLPTGCCGLYAENTLKRGHPDRWPLFCCRELSGCGSG